jgi:Arc/MetJ-type ribon-helix-helix transcriptional regulator
MELSANTITVDLGEMRQALLDRVNSGAYKSPDEVLQAALAALDREDKGLQAWYLKLAEESLADPETDILAADLFRELETMFPATNENPVR